MQQQSLFGNLPSLDAKIKDRAANKAAVQRAGSPRQTGPVVKAQTANAANRFALRMQQAIEIARQKLQPDPELELVTTEERFRQYMTRARANGLIALDTETTGLDPITDKVVGICVYTPGETAIYVPMHHINLAGQELPGQLSDEVVRNELAQLRKGVHRLVFHNAKFDVRMIWNNLGVALIPHWCTYLASNLLNENEPHGLKPLYAKYVLKDPGAVHTFAELFDPGTFQYVPPEVGYLYAAGDPKKTLKLYDFQVQFLDPANPKCQRADLTDAASLLADTEMPLVPVVARMEDTGITLDIAKANELALEYAQRLKDIEAKCHAWLARQDYTQLSPALRGKLSSPINIGSPAQLAILLYDLLDMESPDEKKPRGTGEEILEVFAESTKVGQFAKDVLEYRGIIKMLGTYIEKMPGVAKHVQYVADRAVSGVIHASFNQYGAATGRFSSSDPNLQNIPPAVRRMFVARPGMVLISADYSQQEPRVLAHVSGDEQMIQAYASGKDLYAWIASVVYKLPYDECMEFRADGSKNPDGKKRRSSMKEIILGLMYGRGTKSIAEKLGISFDEAKRITDLFFDSFPKIRVTIQMYQGMARDKGWIPTVWGRKRRLPDIQLPEYGIEALTDEQARRFGGVVLYPDGVVPEGLADAWYRRIRGTRGFEKAKIKKAANSEGVWIVDNGGKIAEAERQTLNSVIQGSSADITKRAMVAIGEDDIIQELGGYLLLTVHDEVILEAPEATALQVAARVRELMLGAADRIKVPMKADVEITREWNGPDIAEELPAA